MMHLFCLVLSTTFHISYLEAGSTAEVGSSIKINRAPPTIATAIDNFLFIPPLSCLGILRL